MGSPHQADTGRISGPRVSKLRKSLADHRDFLASAQIPGESDTLTPTVTDVLEALEDPLSGTLENLVERLHIAAQIESPGNRGTKGAWIYPPKDVRDSVKAIREAHKSLEPFIWNEADVEALRVLDELRELFRNAVRRYEDKKKELSALDFLDLELKAIQLLRTSPNVAHVYRSTFRHILIDEAQDLNPTQKEFLDLLTGEDANEDKGAPSDFSLATSSSQSIDFGAVTSVSSIGSNHRLRLKAENPFCSISRSVPTAGLSPRLTRSWRVSSANRKRTLRLRWNEWRQCAILLALPRPLRFCRLVETLAIPTQRPNRLPLSERAWRRTSSRIT